MQRGNYFRHISSKRDLCYKKGRHTVLYKCKSRIQIQSQEKETSELNCNSETGKESCRENSMLGGQDSLSHFLVTEIIPAWLEHGVRKNKAVMVR